MKDGSFNGGWWGEVDAGEEIQVGGAFGEGGRCGDNGLRGWGYGLGDSRRLFRGCRRLLLLDGGRFLLVGSRVGCGVGRRRIGGILS